MTKNPATAAWTIRWSKNLPEMTVITVQSTEGTTEVQYDVLVTPDETRIRRTCITTYGNTNMAGAWIELDSPVGEAIINLINDNL